MAAVVGIGAGVGRVIEGAGEEADELAAEFESIELRRKEPMASCGMHVQLPNYQHELSRRFLGACSPDVHPDLAPRSSFNSSSRLSK